MKIQQDDFEELLGKSAQAIRNANRKIREVIIKRGGLHCGKGFLLSLDCMELIRSLKELSALMGDKDGGFSQKIQIQQEISNVKAEDGVKISSEEV